MPGGLAALAAFEAEIAAHEGPFLRPGGGEPIGPGVVSMPYPVEAEIVRAFRDAAYREGWVMPGFDWSDWAKTPEAAAYFADPSALAAAPEGDLYRAITALVRADRFAEGRLAKAVEDGTVGAIAARAAALLAARG